MEERDFKVKEAAARRIFGFVGVGFLWAWFILPERARALVLASVILGTPAGGALYLARGQVQHFLGTDEIPTLVKNQNHMARGLGRVPIIAQAFQAVDSEDRARKAYDSIAAAHQRAILGDNRQTSAQVGGNYIWALTAGVVP